MRIGNFVIPAMLEKFGLKRIVAIIENYASCGKVAIHNGLRLGGVVITSVNMVSLKLVFKS